VAQPVQQPAQQSQNNVDANLIAELKAEVAALRAEHRMAQPQYPQPMYAPQPQYLPQPAQGGDVNAELRARLAEERAKSAEERLFRSTEERAMLAEDRLLRGGYPISQLNYQPANLPAIQNAAGNNAGAAPSYNSDVLCAVIASMVRNLASSPALPQEPKKIETPQIIEAESQPVAVNTPTMYPPDAVITTTTTVDTTNRGKVINGGDRGDESLFDIDGFYDKFDESK
ncbi:MAG: hypothetical protein K2G96_05700, partial [Clostridia bacterium]|nr:hypothetical protein [Clostridia bacterium]